MDQMLRLKIANQLLSSLPTAPSLYIANNRVRIFVDRRGTGFANVDIPVFVNRGNGFLMSSARGFKRPNVPWGGTQERFIAEVAMWVDEGFKWRDGYLDTMAQEHSHWVPAYAIHCFKEAIGVESAEVQP